MAVMMIMEVPGGTKDQYKKVNELMGVRGDEDAPDGLIQHLAAVSEDGMVVVDVWESQEALDRFFSDRLRAALAGAGLGSDSPPRVHELHNAFQGAGSEPNVVLIMDMADL